MMVFFSFFLYMKWIENIRGVRLVCQNVAKSAFLNDLLHVFVCALNTQGIRTVTYYSRACSKTSGGSTRSTLDTIEINVCICLISIVDQFLLFDFSCYQELNNVSKETQALGRYMLNMGYTPSFTWVLTAKTPQAFSINSL